MATYSFLDVHVSILGPGGSFSLGSGAGAADEGITVSMAEEKNTMTIGADGTPMHSLHASKGGKFTVRLLKTSPINAQLSTMYALQTASSSAHGLNTITITNNISGDSVVGALCAFKKFPDVTYAKEAGSVEWEFDVGVLDLSLGGGLLANLASVGAGTL